MEYLYSMEGEKLTYNFIPCKKYFSKSEAPKSHIHKKKNRTNSSPADYTARNVKGISSNKRNMEIWIYTKE